MKRLTLFAGKDDAVAASDFLRAHALQEEIAEAIISEGRVRREAFKYLTERGENPCQVLGNLPQDDNGHYYLPDEWARCEEEVASTSSYGTALTAENIQLDQNSSQLLGSMDPNPTAGSRSTARTQVQAEAFTQNQLMSQPFDHNSVVISEQGLLKGLIMLTHFLIIHKKVTSAVRMLYENHILMCLTVSS